jgi:hypothetical protein
LNIAWRSTAALGFALVAACNGSGEGLDENGQPPGAEASGPLEPTIDSIQAHVFGPICSPCHQGATAPENLMLSDTQTSYDNLVNVRATEYPVLFRVSPGDPDNSYLIHKLEGTQEMGAQMPKGETPLSPETIAVIRQWIANGAPPPGSQ